MPGETAAIRRSSRGNRRSTQFIRSGSYVDNDQSSSDSEAAKMHEDDDEEEREDDDDDNYQPAKKKKSVSWGDEPPKRRCRPTAAVNNAAGQAFAQAVANGGGSGGVLKMCFEKDAFIIRLDDIRKGDRSVIHRVDTPNLLRKFDLVKGGSRTKTSFKASQKYTGWKCTEHWKYIKLKVCSLTTKADKIVVDVVLPSDDQIDTAFQEYRQCEDGAPISPPPSQQQSPPLFAKTAKFYPTEKRSSPLTISAASPIPANSGAVGKKDPLWEQAIFIAEPPPVESTTTGAATQQPQQNTGTREVQVSPERQAEADDEWTQQLDVCLQALLSYALDHRFLTQIAKGATDNDREYWRALYALKERTTRSRARLQRKAAITDEISDACEAFSECQREAVMADDAAENPLFCTLCKENGKNGAATALLSFCGEKHDEETLMLPKEDDTAIAQMMTFALCTDHADLVDDYFWLTHARYNLFIECCKKVQIIGITLPGAKARVVDEAINDKKWCQKLMDKFTQCSRATDKM